MKVIVDEYELNIIFGCVRLKKISVEDIELVRLWRNLDRIRNTMVYKDIITPEQQLRWFNNLSQDSDFYFLIIFNDDPIGLVNLKNVNKSSAEAGVFIGEESFDGMGYAFVAVFLINYFAFNILHLEKLVATILDENKSAIRFNKSLGYILEKSENGIGNYSLLKESFNAKYTVFEKMASRVV